MLIEHAASLGPLAAGLDIDHATRPRLILDSPRRPLDVFTAPFWAAVILCRARRVSSCAAWQAWPPAGHLLAVGLVLFAEALGHHRLLPLVDEPGTNATTTGR